jgi:hypothetical protein
MRIFTLLLLVFLVLLSSCSKEDNTADPSMNAYTDSKFIKKILPAENSLWLVTSTVEPNSCASCSNINYVDGLAYSSSNDFNYLDKIGTLLDAETDGEYIVVISPTSIARFNTSIERNEVKNAGSDEEFKLMDKAADGTFWFLSNKAIFNLTGDKIALSGNFPAIDFEVASDHSFWIATNDTVYHIAGLLTEKYPLSTIYGTPSNTVANTPAIFSLKIDRTDSVWINTSDKVFKLRNNTWAGIKVGTYLGDNFKSIPFMDVDKDGRLWVAEKNYQAFTDLHYCQNNTWTNIQLDTPLTNWITDIESEGDGNILIGTYEGLLRLKIN